jgi:hypothetical protein
MITVVHKRYFIIISENLGQKSSRNINTSRISDSPLNFLLSIFGVNSKDTSSLLTMKTRTILAIMAIVGVLMTWQAKRIKQKSRARRSD